MPLNINEIAKLAGVGTGTVSRYINHKPHVSIDKQRRIQAVIDEFDYVPSAIATQLRTQSTGTIGLLVSRITNPFFATLFDHVERKLSSLGYQVIVAQTHDDPESEKRFLMQLQSKKVDGILMASIENISTIKKLGREFQNKIVLLNESFFDTGLGTIKLNHYQGTWDGLSHLYNLGRKKIAYATGGVFDTVKHHGSDRNKAYKDFCSTHDIEMNKRIIFENQHTIQDGVSIAKKLLQYNKSEIPDSIFTNSDEVAIGLINELKRNGMEVPLDLSVVGYDDQPMAEFAEVPLTTIRQPVSEMADMAVKMLLSGLRDERIEEQVQTLNLKLIVRKSA